MSICLRFICLSGPTVYFYQFILKFYFLFFGFQDDPFSMSNLIRMGIKVALAVFSSYTNDDIDRIDKVSPTQVTNQRLRDFNENLAKN